MPQRWSRSLLAGAMALALVLGAAGRASGQSATTTVSGRVTAKTGEPIQGASVVVENSQYGTITGADGRYSLNVPGNRTGPATLGARLIGYRPFKQAVTLNGSRVTADFVLTPQATQLNEVVVTALSQQREKATISTAQQTITSEDITRTQAPNLINAMSGKVAGLQISNSGNMGGSSRIVIRGAGSILGNNQPLFIVDGQPVSNAGFSTASASSGRDYGTAISDINMDDVASLTVLKGPNAAALYGSRASNGAVVITTKNGRNMLRGTKISFTTRATADQMSIFPSYQNGYGQGFGGEFNYVDGAGSGVNDGGDESWGPKLDGRTHGCVMVPGTPAGTTNYDQSVGCDQFSGQAQPWIAHPDNVRNFFRTGSTFSNNLNVSTSGDASGARMSLTKDETRGIVPNTSLSKLGGTFSANATVREKLTLGGNLQYTQTGGKNRPENGYTEGNPFMTFTWFGRQVDVAALKNHYYNTASPYGFADGTLYNWNDNYHRNPWWQYNMNPAPDSRDRVIAQVNANYEITPWLSGLVRAAGDQYRQSQEQDFAKGNIDNASASYNGGFTNSTNRARESNVEGLLTAKKSTEHFDVTANFGGNTRRNDAYDEAFRTNSILVEGIYNLANSAIAPTVSDSESHSAVNSSYGSIVATFNKVLTLEGTARNDWSSTLPKENSSYFYPSVSGSLLVSDIFPAMTNNGMLTYLKLRGSWARVGSDATAYQLATTFSGNANKFNGLPQFSLVNKSANAFLKPERTTGKEAGVEFAMFDDRITVDATYYNKITADQILPLTVTAASGFTSTVINAGQITNKGFEATLTARPVKLANGFTWTSTLNYLKNKNRVDALAPNLPSLDIVPNQWGAYIQAREGQPYGVLWGTGWLRDSATNKIITKNGLPVSNPTLRILGNVNPDWTGGWANEFHYKSFTLSSLLDVRRGGQNFSIGNWWGMYAGVLESSLKGREVDWNKPGLVVDGLDQVTGKPNATVVTAEDYGHSLFPTAEPAVFNSGFVKLREVRVAFDVPSRYLGKLNLSQMNVAFVGRNLMTWTDFPNYDPENATNAGNGGQGFDMGAMPTTRNLGINVTITP
ncbi:MAG: TonB-dependent outer membrane protein SusC/RagA [Gemmatimonadetes bacterium]|nr:TonB-dependent outer membrane protein SusC/RagA [Gemmatimonadota bacterium]